MFARKYIVDCMKNLYNSKYITARDGNVSFKPKNANFFYISPSSIKKNEIDEDQIIKIYFKKSDIIFPNKLNYNFVYNNNNYKPSKELLMHSIFLTDEIFKDEDIFLVHAHPPNIISYTGLNKSNELKNIKKIFPEVNFGRIGNNVKYKKSGSYDLSKECYDKLNNFDIVALEKHGSLSIGNNYEEILENMDTLEYYINIKLRTFEK